jgi:hypothetical protein
VDGAVQWAADLGLLDNTQLNVGMSEEHFERLKGHLERRLENIKTHVVKMVDPDKFLLETMEKAEKNMIAKPSELLASNTRKRYEQLHRVENLDPMPLFESSLEQVQVAIPPPTRNQRDDKKTALLHLEKMRASATLLLAWMMLPDKSKLPPDIMKKASAAAEEGIEFVTKVMKEHRKEAGEQSVCLEDAWMRPLVLTADGVDSLEEPDKKRPKTSRPVIRSRILLTPGRKTPSNLLPAFKRKRATLVRPEPRGEGSHVILEFEKAFIMTIYFVPLVVTLRAYSDDTAKPSAPLECAPFLPLGSGLAKQSVLSVWGIKGDVATLGHLVEQRLQDASSHATYILRKCFENNIKENETDFEIEIREATALLEFIHLARATYMPNWQDDDV